MNAGNDDVDFSDGFHAEFFEIDHFDLFDVRLVMAAGPPMLPNRSRVLVAGVGDDFAAVAFGDHDQAAAVERRGL